MDRLLLILIAILFYFVFLTASDIVFLVNQSAQNDQSGVYMAIYYLIHAVFCICLLAGYKHYMRHSDRNDIAKTMVNMSKRDIFKTSPSSGDGKSPTFGDDKSEPLTPKKDTLATGVVEMKTTGDANVSPFSIATEENFD